MVSPAPEQGKSPVNPNGGIFRPDAYRDYWPEPFIDRRTWETVQAKLALVKTQHGPRKDRFPLSGLLRCGRAGALMGGATSLAVSGQSKRYVYRKYVCYTARGHGRHACGNQSIREDRLLPLLVDRLRNVSLAPKRLEELRR